MVSHGFAAGRNWFYKMSNNYQWYPGHMTKARRAMQEDIKLVDLVIELLDARIPYSSRNPEIDKLAMGKARLVLLNKADLASERMNEEWISYFKSKNIECIKLDSRNRSSAKRVDKLVEIACKEKIERNRARGIIGRPIRAMVVGIPNVGKSTFINSFAGKACAKTGNKPGVTKGKQWIKLSKTLELLDTPGILWPKFEDQSVGEHLAFIGSMNDQILELSELALSLATLLAAKYPGLLEERYTLSDESVMPTEFPVIDQNVKYLYRIAYSRACVKKGNEPDLDKASSILLEDFRAGRLGKITLEEAVNA